MNTIELCDMDHERRMENRWYIIYRISNTHDDDTYIGCTSKLLKYRLQEHVYNTTRSNTKLSIKIRGVGKENLDIIDLVSRRMTWVDAHRIEGQLIDVLEPTLNMKSSGKYYDDDGNYDRSEYCKDYGRERNSIKTSCECGGSYTPSHKAQHKRTQKHQRHLDSVSVFSPPHSPCPNFVNPEDSMHDSD